MAYFYEEPSRTFGEYLLVPGYSSAENVPTAVSLKTPLVKYRKGEEACPLEMNIPMISAIMQSVSGDKLAIALAREGGVSFIYGSQSIENEAAMVRRVKSYKAGYVVSDSNLAPTATLHDVLELKARTGHSTIAVTADGTPHGKLMGIVASRDYRVNHTPDDASVTTFMTPIEKLVTAPENTSLHDCNNIIWDNKINTLPLVDAEGNLKYFVFRKDYDSHKKNVNELLDANKSYVVGAGINTRDYAQRVPALVEAGVDVLCIDSSEGYSEWQSRTIAWIREHYGDTVKVGAGNVVDREGFRYLARAGACPLAESAVPALSLLKGAGVQQVILSASNLPVLEQQVTERGVRPYFARLLGLDNIYARSKVEVGLAYLTELKQRGAVPAQAIMIGDSVHDFEVAQALGVPESVIALTFVALGTSLPELVTAITSLVKGCSDLSLGNIVGANVFNLVLVSGASVTIAPFTIPQSSTLFGINSSLVLDLPVMLAVMVLMCVPALVRGKLSRVQGVLLLCSYAACCAIQFTM